MLSATIGRSWLVVLSNYVTAMPASAGQWSVEELATTGGNGSMAAILDKKHPIPSVRLYLNHLMHSGSNGSAMMPWNAKDPHRGSLYRCSPSRQGIAITKASLAVVTLPLTQQRPSWHVAYDALFSWSCF